MVCLELGFKICLGFFYFDLNKFLYLVREGVVFRFCFLISYYVVSLFEGKESLFLEEEVLGVGLWEGKVIVRVEVLFCCF